MSRLAALLAVAVVLAPAGCGGSGLFTTDGIARCLADRGVTTAPRGDSAPSTEVLSFQVPGTPANGLLIFVQSSQEAETLEHDIRETARAAGAIAHTLRAGNVIAHFLTSRAPTRRAREPIRACLKD